MGSTNHFLRVEGRLEGRKKTDQTDWTLSLTETVVQVVQVVGRGVDFVRYRASKKPLMSVVCCRGWRTSSLQINNSLRKCS